MEMTIGKRIGQLRRSKGIKQEELATQLGISAQAVSKWENDQTCPDIMLLPRIARILGTTVDHLLSGEEAPVARMVPPEKRRELKDMMLKLVVESKGRNRVRINLPMTLVELAASSDVKISTFTGHEGMDHMDLKKMLELARQGVEGNLMEMETSDGDTIRIFIE